MNSFQLGTWTIDLGRQLAVRGDERANLSANETALLRYLRERADPVTRAEVLQNVFGYAPTSRSRAVETALRRLRPKLEVDPKNPKLVCGRPGVGLWLEGVTGRPTEETSLTLGTMDLEHAHRSPYQPRPQEEERVERLREEGWRVVTIVGPGGAGKTRLAAEVARNIDSEVVAVHLGGAAGRDDVVRRICGVAGVPSGSLAALGASLKARRALVLLDEAETAHAAVVDVVVDLVDATFLVTSRRPLGVRGEALVEVGGLVGEEGRRFLQSRVAASRGPAAPVDVLEDAIGLLDGLPLGLELAASHPDGLEAFVDELREGGLPAGAVPLLEALRRSIDPLDEATRGVLLALSLCEGSMTASDVRDWLGEGAEGAVRTLADRSLLCRQGRGWVLPRTSRAFVQQQPADWAALRDSYQRWLVGRAVAWSAEFLLRPRWVGPRWQSLCHDMHRELESLPVEQVPSLVFALHRLYDALGPTSAREDVVQIGLSRAPEDITVKLLGAVRLRRSGGLAEVLREAASAGDDVQLLALEVQTLLVPDEVDRVHALSLAKRLEGADALRARCFAEQAHRGQDPDALAALEGEARSSPLVKIDVVKALAKVHLRRDDLVEAQAAYRRAAELAAGLGLERAALVMRQREATVQSWGDPLGGAEAHLRVARRCERLGETPGFDLARAGVSLYLVDDLQRALPLLKMGVEGCPAGVMRRRCLAFLLAARLRSGDRTALPALQALRPVDFGRGQVTGTVRTALFHAEALLHLVGRGEATTEELGEALQSCRTMVARQSNHVLVWQLRSLLARADEQRGVASSVVQGRLRVISAIGAGGTATVYRAFDAERGEEVALKLLAADTMVGARLARESRVLASLRHPSVVSVYDVVHHTGRVGLVMELVDGPDLRQLLRSEGPWLPLELVDRIGRGLIAGMGALHDAGLLHRDVKPSNVLLAGPERVPKVADFGLVGPLSPDTEPTFTHTGEVFGTPGYMSPEQSRSAKRLDERSDLWSVGTVLYALATGKKAFPGRDVVAVFRAVRAGIYVAPETVRPDLPERFVRAIHAALVVELEGRVESAASLLSLWVGE